MYYDYFGLKEAPFSIAPNPEYLFMTARHQEALAHLYHGIKSDAGFVLLTGDIGEGFSETGSLNFKIIHA